MRKLKSGYKDRGAKEIVIDEVKFFIKPMAQETMIGLGMYSGGHRDVMMTLGEKKAFIKSHITKWENMFYEDGEAVEFNTAIAIEYLSSEDYDDLFMTLYWESVKLAEVKEKEVIEAKEEVKR